MLAETDCATTAAQVRPYPSTCKVDADSPIHGANIQRHVECPTRKVEGAHVREVLDAYFRANARARGYVLDESGGGFGAHVDLHQWGATAGSCWFERSRAGGRRAGCDPGALEG